MKYWLWSVNQENWPNVKKVKVWGVQKQRKTQDSNIGDYIIFYVKGTLCFKGIFKIISEWKEMEENDLSDVNYIESYQDYPFRCKLEEICMGEVQFHKIIDSLDCKNNVPKLPQFILQNTSWGAANIGKPLSSHDFELIKEKMIFQSSSDFSTNNLELLDNDDSQELTLTNKSELDDSQMTPTHYDITIVPADYTLEVLYNKFKNGEIIIPRFQRNFVWSKTQSSKLIESFLMGLPIPPIYFYIDKDQKSLVIDGSQRLRTIFHYFKGDFGKFDEEKRGRIFKLVGINPEQRFFQLTFNELDDSDKRLLQNQVLRSVLIRQLDPKEDDSSIYHIFERLNTGGTQLKDQEVRNCVYAGSLNDLLLSLNQDINWRLFLGKSKEDIRQKDVELILQYLALYHDLEKYKRPMKDFLSGYMKRNQNPSPDFLKEEGEKFKKICEKLIELFGNRPLNPKGGLNKSIFDAIFVSFAKHIDEIPTDIDKRLKKLYQHPVFQKYTTAGTTNKDAIHYRLQIAEEVLFLNNNN